MVILKKTITIIVINNIVKNSLIESNIDQKYFVANFIFISYFI